jgi:hypothetical protein
MQADHRTWFTAHAQWRKDIERWQAEHKAAVARLAQMQKVVAEHGDALEEHARACRQVEEAIGAHDREISQQQKGTNERPHDVVANQHQHQEGVFSVHQNAHERIRKHHEAVMAQLQALENAAAAAM